MAITRIKNNQITDSSGANLYLGINAAVKLQDFSVTAGKIANSLVYGSDLTVSGNLTVNGTTTTIDTVSVVIEDPILLLAANQTGAPSLDIGYIGERGSSQNIAFVWDESAGEFVTAFTNDTTTNTTVTIASYASFHTKDANIGGNIVINGTTSLVGNIITDAAITGNVRAGNIATAGQISATGNVTSGNLVSNAAVTAAGNISTTIGNISGGNISTTGNIDATGNVSAGNLISSGAVIGNVTITGNLALGNLSVSGQINTTGNITGGNLVSNAAVSAATTVSATGNITGGNLTTTGLTSTATLNASGNANVGNLGTAGLIVATGNITGGNLRSDGTISAATTITATGNITGGNVISNSLITGSLLEISGNATIGGNLVVQGNLSYINVDDLRVEDPVIIMGTGANGAPLTTDDGMDRGIYMEYFKAATGKGNASVFFDNSTGNVVAAANVNFSGNNIINVVQYGTFEAGNLYAQSALITGNVILGNISTAGQITATGNITGGNVISNAAISAATTVTATGNITGGNLITAGLGSIGTTLSVTGNANVGNLGTAGQVTATGNITGGNVRSDATISAATTITASGNITGGNVISNAAISAATTVTATGNITGGNLITAGLGSIGTTLSVTGNANVGNLGTAGLIVATGNITGSNLILTSGFIDSSGSRITINGSDADVDFAVDGDTTANVFYVDAGTGTASFGNSTQVTNALVSFQSTNAILIPRGNSLQRPSTSVTGMIRFNTTTDNLEFYDADGWVSAGSVFTVIDSQIFNGDGSTLTFTLGSDQTTDSCIVSINGIVQIPVTSYAVSGNVMTFTEAPLSQDVIEVRQITTTAQVKSISNSPGNAVIELTDTSNDISITGDLIPTANVAFDLGSSALRWRDGYFSGNSITLGNIVLKNTSGNTLAFFGPDGTTPGVLSSNNVDTTSIANGTSNVQTLTSGAVTLSAGGNANVIVVADGAVTVKANILNGQGNGVGNIGNSTTYFNTIFAKATSAQYADLAEMYAADADLEPGTVVCFGGTAEVTGCTEEACKRVAGVISTNPSYIMNSALEGEHVVVVALTGRVPTRVTGPVRKGDMMVSTADGRARAEPDPRVGTVIGKALEDFDDTEGVIEVVVGRL